MHNFLVAMCFVGMVLAPCFAAQLPLLTLRIRIRRRPAAALRWTVAIHYASQSRV